MINGLLGKKIGMTQVFAKDGTQIPVTALQVGPCTVMQIKSVDNDGYKAIQLGFETRRRKTAGRPAQGHARKAKTEPKYYIREVGFGGDEEFELGQTITLKSFEGIQNVDISGIMKGRGFAGSAKRHGFKLQPKTHGQSDRHRAPGALGRQYGTSKGVPKGKKMTGHMGHVRRTVRNLKVIEIDQDNHLLLVKGGVPGPNGGYCLICRAKFSSR